MSVYFHPCSKEFYTYLLQLYHITEQLMELAGLSVAEAVYDVAKDIDTDDKKKKHVLLVCG